MQVSAVSSMNFYGAKANAAKKAAKAVVPDFSKSAYAVPTGLPKAEKAVETPFVGDYALINIPTPTKSAPSTKPASDYLAASMYIEPKKADVPTQEIFLDTKVVE